MEHELKILPQYFKSVKDGSKPFEIRKNDRDYKVGDTLILKEYDLENMIHVPGGIIGGYTGQEITKEITYILEGGQYGLEEGYCILGLKQEGITLKNINLNGITLDEQSTKAKEEIYEFEVAMNEFLQDKTPKNRKHLIEEYYDYIQSPLGILDMVGITAQEVMGGYPLHEKKLLNRPRKKECTKCFYKINCCLYLSEHWSGEYEAERCKTYKESEE